MLTVTEDEKTEAKPDIKPTSVRLDPSVMEHLDRIAELMHEQRLQARPNRSAALAWVLTNIDWTEVEKRLTKKKITAPPQRATCVASGERGLPCASPYGARLQPGVDFRLRTKVR